MASTPSYAATPRSDYCQISAANTARDGTGTLGTLATGAAGGTRIESVRVVAAGTTTAGVVRLFFSNDGGTTKRLLEEMLVTAVTPSTTVAVFSGRFSLGGWMLKDANCILYAATHNAETFNVFAERAADF
jgi:hypothetical protein